MRLRRHCLLVASVCAAGALRAASFDERIEALFRPALAETIALSPEGHRVAYTMHTGRDLGVVIMSLEHPRPKWTVMVDPDQEAELPTDKPPVQLRFQDAVLFAQDFEDIVLLLLEPTEAATITCNGSTHRVYGKARGCSFRTLRCLESLAA